MKLNGLLEVFNTAYVRKTGGNHFVFVHENLKEQLVMPASRPVKPLLTRGELIVISPLG